MDINVDQGSQQGDLGKFDDGKYLYKFDNGKFDIDKFNRDFDQYKTKRKEEADIVITKKLEELNKPPIETPPYSLSVGQVMINLKDAIFGTIDDLINFNIDRTILTKHHRLFYWGILLIIVAFILYTYMLFMIEETSSPKMVLNHNNYNLS